MKRNLTIWLLIIISVLSLSYGYYQKSRADASESKAVEYEELAKKAQEKLDLAVQMASEQQRMSSMAMMEVEKHRQMLEEELKRKKGVK